MNFGEIETLISKYPNIKNVAVVKQSANNREFISAYFVADKRISINDLRKYLAKSLPRYMIPSYYTPMDEFVYTPNGKIDKKKLPLPQKLTNMRREEYVEPKTELQKNLVRAFENVLNIKPIGINDNFFELGGDSLLAMKLSVELLKITNKISYSDIFKYTTVSEIEEKINSNNEQFIHNKIENIKEDTIEILKHTLEDCKLEIYHPRNVLLTGVTGYLGIHILEQFLKNETGKIYCIIRNEPGLPIDKKIKQKLNYYFGNKYDNLIDKRIVPVLGDICQKNFGVNDEVLNKIKNDIDVVINSAANVAHFGEYEIFRKTNVESVKNTIEFCEKYNKKLYHISTTGVSGKKINPNYTVRNNNIFNESSLYIGQYLDNVYTYTKFEAETIIFDAIARNVDAYILRLGNLMPRLSDGLFQENIKENAFVTKLASFMQIGIMPKNMLSSELEFTPVEIAGNAIYKIITNNCKKNKVFHIYNHNVVTLENYLKIISEKGYNMKVLEEDAFKKKVLEIIQNEKEKTVVQNLATDLDNNYNLDYNSDVILKSDFTIKYLEKCGFHWPKISKEYIVKFIELMRKEI